ncbi:hypothetical protein ABPG77_007571 [Micractinium sp. CCAP 211/92]
MQQGGPALALHVFGGMLGNGKRASERAAEQVMDQAQSKKRAAFEDITNAHQYSEPEASGTGDCSDLYPSGSGPSCNSSQHALHQAHAYSQGCGPHTSYPAPAYGQQQQQQYGGASCRRYDYVDIDQEDVDDPMACTEYVTDIFEYLRESELKRRPTTTYMESVQTDINPMMRSILLDWLVEVGMEYRLTSDTLFLSAAYIDRFLSLVDVRRNRLQLVGVTAMLVASKYEEIYAPQIEEFCYITDNTYTREQVLDMERELLRVLDFDLTQPTIKTFLRRYIKAASGEIPLDVTFEFLCSYLAELTLMDYPMLNYLPSTIAASCVTVALWMLGKPTWTPTLTHYSGYAARDLRHCAQAVHQLFLQAKSSNLPASRDKYGSPKFACVSQLGCLDKLPDWMFA